MVEWANRVGDGLDDLPQEKRRDVLRLLLDEVIIDGENNVNLTLAVPTEELVSIGSPVSTARCIMLTMCTSPSEKRSLALLIKVYKLKFFDH